MVDSFVAVEADSPSRVDPPREGTADPLALTIVVALTARDLLVSEDLPIVAVLEDGVERWHLIDELEAVVRVRALPWILHD